MARHRPYSNGNLVRANVSQMVNIEAPSPMVTAIASPPTSVSPHDLAQHAQTELDVQPERFEPRQAPRRAGRFAQLRRSSQFQPRLSARLFRHSCRGEPCPPPPSPDAVPAPGRIRHRWRQDERSRGSGRRPYRTARACVQLSTFAKAPVDKPTFAKAPVDRPTFAKAPAGQAHRPRFHHADSPVGWLEEYRAAHVGCQEETALTGPAGRGTSSDHS